MVFRSLCLLTLLLGTLHVAAGAGGPAIDCLLDVVGTRGSCMGVCVLDGLQTVISDLPNNCLNTVSNFVNEVTCTGAEFCYTYNYFYDEVFADRTKLCGLMDGLNSCTGSAVKQVCDQFGLNFINDLVDFTKGHMTCDTPKENNLMTCVANPDLVQNQNFLKCFTDVENDRFIQELISDGDINAVLRKLKDSKGEICRLYDQVTSCIVGMIENQISFDTYCSNDDTKLLKEIISDIKQLVGCTNEAYYDLLECGLEFTCNIESVINKCDLLKTFEKIAEGTTMTCDLLSVVACVRGELSKVCSATGWTLMKEKQLLDPIIDYLNIKLSCSVSKPNAVSTCGCFGTFPIGGEPATCDVADTLPRCTSDASNVRVGGLTSFLLLMAVGLFTLLTN